MVKLVFCLRRRPELTWEEFSRYWFEHHAPLVRKHAEALGVRRYVQLHRLGDPVDDALRAGRGGPEPYDGVAELWFDSLDAMRRAGGTPEGRAAGAELLEDERRFIDLEASPLWVAEERQVVPDQT